ncbi:Vitamin B12 transporter BtuB (Cobalamin receptor) (Outer membrane cobalamin translocator) [Durusdinium trenchii]|uniref:Vitamin B12 transporter BtuB (Cobalamin receptor) (Outer membrane cobalamin translocator) n=1 Tax=Durusdinium trenchii TaxID=1381693 RepID=A0ABP0LLC4_9DINO
MTPEDLAAFREWMQRSPRHHDEVLRLAYLSNELNILTEMAGPLEDADANSDDEIIVTGSRIARSGTTTPTPTIILDAEAISASGAVNVGDLLREIPAIGPGLNADSTAPTFSSAGLNLVDLRRLGTERTLVLINGRRQVGSEPGTTAVDLNTIPTPLIERVDVITGGASAVYGADAVSGVVNFVLKDDFEGLELDIQGGVSDEGDAEQFQVSLTGGAVSSDGRGRAVFHGSYSREGSIEFDERSTAISGTNWIPNPANTGPNDGIPDFVLTPNVRQLGGQQEAAFILDRGNGNEVFGFNPDGSLRPFALGPSGLLQGNLTDGGEATLGFDPECPQNRCQLKVPVERFLMYGSAEYDITDKVTGYFTGSFANTQTESRIGSVFEIPPFTNDIPLDNPFVTDEVRALFAEANALRPADDQLTSVGIVRSNTELGPRGTDGDRRQFQMVVGAKGDLGDWGGTSDWSYDTSFQYGSTLVTIVRLNDLFQNRFVQALDAVVDPSDGQIRCRSVVEGTAQDPGCVPINLLQSGASLTPEAQTFVRIPDPTETAELQQFVASGTLTGNLFDPFGAGPIGVAVGGEWRQENSRFTPAATQAGTPIGLTGVIPQRAGPGGSVTSSPGGGLGFFNSTRRAVSGDFSVYEFFGETLVPVLRDQPFAHQLNIEAAVRYANYSTSGSATSWKFGGDWAPTPDIRFRGVRSRAVRAPNVGELFSPGTEGFVTVDDPCDQDFISGGGPNRAANCAALGVTQPFESNARTINIRTAFSGNPDLEVEVADTWTVGAVLTPQSLPNFSMTVDYYSIEISNAINSFGTQQILDSCVDLESIDNVFCQNITRSASGELLLVQSRNLNVSSFTREGIDVEARYNLDLGDKGVVTISGVANRVLTNETVVAPGTIAGGDIIDTNGQIGDPKWRTRATTGWRNGPFGLTTTVSFMSNQVPDITPATPEDNRATTGTGGFTLVDLQGQYDITEGTTLRAGIDNVFDNLPPNLPDTRQGGAGSFAGAEIFPITGRFFYVGARVRF